MEPNIYDCSTNETVTLSITFDEFDLFALRNLQSIVDPESKLYGLFAHILEQADMVATLRRCPACETEVGTLNQACLRCGQLTEEIDE